MGQVPSDLAVGDIAELLAKFEVSVRSEPGRKWGIGKLCGHGFMGDEGRMRGWGCSLLLILILSLQNFLKVLNVPKLLFSLWLSRVLNVWPTDQFLVDIIIVSVVEKKSLKKTAQIFYGILSFWYLMTMT